MYISLAPIKTTYYYCPLRDGTVQYYCSCTVQWRKEHPLQQCVLVAVEEL